MPSLRCRLRAGVYSTLIIVGSPALAHACRCIEPKPQQAYSTADSVALGQFLSRKDGAREGDVVYVMAVSQSWKRQLDPQITVYSGTTCRFDAEVGARYVIFVKRDRAGNYYTARCLGNRSEPEATPTLNYLRAIQTKR